MVDSTPLGPLITLAQNGELSVRMEPEEFAKIEYECQAFKTTIRQIQEKIDGVSRLQTWGFGDHAGSNLSSATTIAERFRKKSSGQDDGNDFHTVLDEHWAAVEDIRLLHSTIRDRFVLVDTDFAARFAAEAARLDQVGGL
ncbi:hypothetical protein ACWEVD_18810 [Nocardia thailandica]